MHSLYMAVDDEISALCSVAEAADLLRVHPTTALRWALAGKLRVVGKLSGETGSYVLDRTVVERLAEERAKAAEADRTEAATA